MTAETIRIKNMKSNDCEKAQTVPLGFKLVNSDSVAIASNSKDLK
jgi:hypothetical protein